VSLRTSGTPGDSGAPAFGDTSGTMDGVARRSISNGIAYHGEIVVECDADQTEVVAAWLLGQ
jgi:hypothetical protein